MSLFNFTSPMSMPMPEFPFGQSASQVLTGPSAATSTPAVSMAVEEHQWFDPSAVNMGQQQSSGRRVSFGSVFQESSGNGAGNGNGGEERRDNFGGIPSQAIHGSSGTM